MEKTFSQLYLDVQSRPDGKDFIYHIKGIAFAFIDGVRPQPLFGYEGFNVRRRVETPEKDGYFVATRELLFYTDIQTGEVLWEYDNPLNGEKCEVFHITNDPVNFRMRREDARYLSVSLDGKIIFGEPKPPKEMGDYYIYSADVFPFYPIPGWEKNYTSCEIFDFYVPKSARYTDDPPKVLNTWVRVGPWLPWLKMDGKAGHIIYHAHSQRHEDWEALPEYIKKLVHEKYPEYRTAPETVDPTKPNATSWSVYNAEMKRRQEKS